jgi:hypothetical protein
LSLTTLLSMAPVPAGIENVVSSKMKTREPNQAGRDYGAGSRVTVPSYAPESFEGVRCLVRVYTCEPCQIKGMVNFEERDTAVRLRDSYGYTNVLNRC